jgi:hypothetical protein
VKNNPGIGGASNIAGVIFSAHTKLSEIAEAGETSSNKEFGESSANADVSSKLVEIFSLFRGGLLSET